MNLSVAIISWAPLPGLLRAIESVRKQTLLPREIIIVDNRGSLPLDQIPDWPDLPIRVIRAPFNLGCPPARNLAFANCTGEWIYSLDDDGWLHPDALRISAELADRSPDAAIVQSRVVSPDGSPQIDIPEGELDMFPGAGACLMRKASFERVGMYPAHFFRQVEETHLFLRLRDARYTVVGCPGSVMFHDKRTDSAAGATEIVYGLAHSLRTVAELWPVPSVPMGVFGKTLSWLIYALKERQPIALARGALVFATIRRHPSQTMLRRVKWATVRKSFQRKRPRPDIA